MTAGPANEVAPGVETCPRCGSEFACSAAEPGTHCWCATVTLTDQHLAGLAHRYAGCLCPACLGELAGT